MLGKLMDLDIKGDERGSLVAIEEQINLPFEIKRIFFIYGTSQGVSRGKHAHKTFWEALVCVSGSCKVELTDGDTKECYTLSQRNKMLVIPPLVWLKMYDFTHDCVLLAIADQVYSPEENIHSFSEYQSLKQAKDIKVECKVYG